MSMPQLSAPLMGHLERPGHLGRPHLSLALDATSTGTVAWGGRSIDLAAGQTMAIEPGATGLVHLLSGMLKMVAGTDDGRRSILRLCLPGDVSPYRAEQPPSGRRISFVAITRSRVTTLNESQVGTLLEDPTIALDLLGIFAREIRNSHDRSTRHKLDDGHVRTASTICGFAERLGQRVHDRVIVQHPLTHNELAMLSGLTRETFGRALSGFIARGWVLTDRQTITILDEDALRRRARLPRLTTSAGPGSDPPAPTIGAARVPTGEENR